ncbi:MAG: nucleotidyltransferase domain-containing protein [Legionellales bacterium]|jgi:predicted nucleotidyltransferase
MLDILPEDKLIILQILKRHLPVSAQVWVFGSRAKSNAKPYSDLDLAIDLNGETLSLQLLANLAFDFEESDLPYKVDIVDWNAIDTTFQARIRIDCQALDL